MNRFLPLLWDADSSGGESPPFDVEASRILTEILRSRVGLVSSAPAAAAGAETRGFRTRALGFLSNALAPGAGGGAKPAEGGPVGKADVDAIGAAPSATMAGGPDRPDIRMANAAAFEPAAGTGTDAGATDGLGGCS